MSVKQVAKRKIHWRIFLTDALLITIGSLCYAISVNIFTAYNAIAPGGLTGVATMVNHFTGWPIGAMVLVINIPLFFLGSKKIGHKFLIKTIITTLLTSVLIDVTRLWLPVYGGEKILAALYGGVFSGLGLGLVFLRGGTTGGTDIIAKLINSKWKHISMGRIILVIDALIVTASGLVFRNVDSALYAMVTMFASSMIIDKLVYGADAAKTLMVISGRHQEISEQLMNKLRRGVTVLEASGGYTEAPKKMLMCTLRSHEVSKAYQLIRSIDSSAFIVVLEAGEVLGEGFKAIS